MAIWLVHLVTEGDLCLDPREVPLPSSPEGKEERGQRMAARCRSLNAAPPDQAGALLREGRFDDGFPNSARRPRLARVLSAIRDVEPLHVVLVGTDSGDPVDSKDLAEAIEAGLRRSRLDDRIESVQRVTSGFSEAEVLGKVRELLTGHPGDRAVVTISTGLSLAAMAAALQAGLPVTHVLPDPPGEVSESVSEESVDHLGGLNLDPAASVLTRWRLFPELQERAKERIVTLTDDQRRVVFKQARRHRDGYKGETDGLLALVSEAVLRRDGTEGLPIRRYITARYDDLRAPDEASILTEDELGPQLMRVREEQEHKAPEAISPALAWLASDEALDINLLGVASHALEVATPSATLVDFLRVCDGCGQRCYEVGLARPPVVAGNDLLALWVSADREQSPSVGRQLASEQPPYVVLSHLRGWAPETVGLRCRIFSLPGKSEAVASEAVGELASFPIEELGPTIDKVEASSSPLPPDGADDKLEEDIAAAMSESVGSVMVVPVGPKPAMMRVLRAARRVAARQGIPVTLRDNANVPAGSPRTVHLLPALTGGDLPLLLAARGALDALELETAARLLLSTGAFADSGLRAWLLANAFLCRLPPNSRTGPQSLPNWPVNLKGVQLEGLSRGLMAQRLELVAAVGRGGHERAGRTRRLVLASGLVEISVVGHAPHRPRRLRKNLWDQFQKGLMTPVIGEPAAEHRAALLALIYSRNKAPVTHASEGEQSPDSIVRRSVNDAARRTSFSPQAPKKLPKTVDELLAAACAAARVIGPELGPRAGGWTLLQEYEQVHAEVTKGIELHQSLTDRLRRQPSQVIQNGSPTGM